LKINGMKDRAKYDKGQLFNFAPDSYLERTSRPIYAIVFLLPFIIFYELGTIFINTDVLNETQVRVVAFVWLHHFLNEYLGFGSKLAWLAPPLAVMAILTGLQLASRKRWRFGTGDICPMAVECVLLAVPLIVLSLLLNNPANQRGDVGPFVNNAAQVRVEAVHGCSVSTTLEVTSEKGNGDGLKTSLLANIVTGIGAGIYEELVFRLILICVLMLLFQDVLRFGSRNSIILSVLVSAALFSAHHHIDFLSGQLNQRDPFDLTKFIFRTIAGIYFAVLFAIRGFGITAGTHAFYDIIATILNAAFFEQ